MLRTLQCSGRYLPNRIRGCCHETSTAPVSLLANVHELGIASSALRLALERTSQTSASRIARVTVRIGALSGVDPDAFRFAFDAIKVNTVAELAELEIERVPAVAHCAGCRTDFEPDEDFIAICPSCGQISGEICGGRELELVRVECSG